MFVERYLDWVRRGRGYRIKFSLVRKLDEGGLHNFVHAGNRGSNKVSPFDTIEEPFCFVTNPNELIRVRLNSRSKLKTEGQSPLPEAQFRRILKPQH